MFNSSNFDTIEDLKYIKVGYKEVCSKFCIYLT